MYLYDGVCLCVSVLFTVFLPFKSTATVERNILTSYNLFGHLFMKI